MDADAVGPDGYQHLLGVARDGGVRGDLERLAASAHGARLDRCAAGDCRRPCRPRRRGEALTAVARRQRCVVHLQRNVLTQVPRRLRPRLVREVTAEFRAPTPVEAKGRLTRFRTRRRGHLPKAMACLEAGFGAATVFFGFPPAHWRRRRTTNSIERLHREIKRRTRVVGAFPDRASTLRLITAVAIEATAIWGRPPVPRCHNARRRGFGRLTGDPGASSAFTQDSELDPFRARSGL